MKNIFIFDTEEIKGVTKVSQGDSVVIHSQREKHSLIPFLRLEEVNSPGVYILISEGQIYVGQSKVSVTSRLRSHEKAKSWWTSCLVITDSHGMLDGASIDYMEYSLISHFSREGVNLDNENGGVKTKVHPFSKFIADSIMTTSLSILNDVLRIEFPKGDKLSLESAKPTHSKYSVRIGDEFSTEVSASSPKKALIATLYRLASGQEYYGAYYMKLYAEVGDPDSGSLIRDREGENTVPIGHDLYLCTSFGNDQAIQYFDYFSEVLGVDLTLSEISL